MSIATVVSRTPMLVTEIPDDGPRFVFEFGREKGVKFALLSAWKASLSVPW